MSEARTPVEGDPMHDHDNYLIVANQVSRVIVDLLRGIHNENGNRGLGLPDGSGANAAPLIQGAIGGIMQFCMVDGGMSQAEVSEIITGTMEESGPQIEFFLQERAAGATSSGRA